MNHDLAAITARVRADEAWRDEPCTCGRKPGTPAQHRFLTGNYACRHPQHGSHRHWQRTCEGCGEVRWRPNLDEDCALVGIGEG